MKSRNVDASQTTRKVTKLKKRSKKSRAARRRSIKKKRRKFRAAVTLHQRSSKRAETLPHRTSSVGASFAVCQGITRMSGDWYWLNYNNVFQWKDHHLSNYGVTAYSLPGQSQWLSERQGPSLRSVEGCVGGLRGTAGSHEPFETSTATEVDFRQDGFEEADVTSDVESDEDIVVTEEMMQFLEISLRHKASLNVKKQEAMKNEDKKIRNDERDANEDCLVPSDAADNENRRVEMAVLYGEKAPVIHGMETALQLSFNKQVDMFNPSYWPIHPFTIQFNS